MKKILLLTVLLAVLFAANAQVSENDRSMAMQLIQKNGAGVGLMPNDLDNSIVTGTYIIPGSEIRMVYLQQSL